MGGLHTITASTSPTFTNLYLTNALAVAQGGTGLTSGYNNSNWDTAYSGRLQWDGGNTNLVAATGRTSLGLGALAVLGVPASGIVTSNGSALSNITDSSSNWNTAYTQTERWNGGSTDLVAATGRTSLGLGTMALLANTGSTTITTLGTITAGTWNGGVIPILYGGTGTTTPGLIQGSNITITGTWPFQTISSTGGSGSSTPGGSTLNLQYNKSNAFAGSSNLLYYDTPLPTPAAPTLAIVGSTGSKTYGYSVVAIGQLGYSSSSPIATVTNGFNPLSGSNYITVTTTAVASSTSCDIWRVPLPTTRPGAGVYIANVPCGNAYNDIGTSSFSPNNTQVMVQHDASAGVLINQNLKVTGYAAFGSATLGQNINHTSAQIPVAIEQTVTDPNLLDPTNLLSNLILAPTANDITHPHYFTIFANVDFVK